MSRLVVLGSGTSYGVPVIGCDCAVCRSSDPRDRRTRCAAYVEWDDDTRILIDTPPEVRLQLVAREIGWVSAVLYTHDHADHMHGIDDLRAISAHNGSIPLYGARDTLASAERRFGYIFDHGYQPAPDTSKPELTPVEIEPLVPFRVGAAEVLPIPFNHGPSEVLGFRIGPVAYLTDVKQVPPEAIDLLRGVRYLVLNALFERPHSSHLSIPEAIEVVERIGPEQAWITHLTHRYGHAALEARLPAGIEPAYDGLEISF